MALTLNAAQALTGFAPTVAPGCDAISAQGSVLYVAPPLEDANLCQKLPRKFSLTCPESRTTSNSTMKMFISATSPTMTTPTVYLQAGTVLYFADTVKVTVATSIKIVATTELAAVDVDVAISGSIAEDDVAETYAMYEARGATDLTDNDNAQTQDTSKLSTGFQGSMITTRVSGQIPIQYQIGDSGDWAWHKVLFPCGQNGRRFFCYLASTDGTRIYGNAIVTPQNRSRQSGGLITGSLQLELQAPYVKQNIRQEYGTTQQGYIDTLEKLVGTFGTLRAA